MAPSDVLTLTISLEEAGTRLDSHVAGQLTDCTRSHATMLIRQGHILVDGLRTKPSYRIKGLERISIRIPAPQPVDLIPEPIPLDILFEDHHLIVINKPPGLVVHPAAGHTSGTLVNGILHHCPDLEGIGGEIRPGIVHRLDKDTSGVIVVAKTALALQGMSQQFKARRVVKRYVALIHGIPDRESGSVDLPVGRHPVDRKRMSTISSRGRQALTLWRIREKYHVVALLDVDLKTGRTHQIRVHCQSMGHPIVGDTVYGGSKAMSQLTRRDPTLCQVIQVAQRQMLHASQLELVHPITAQDLQFEAPLPEDMGAVVEALRKIT